MNKFYKTIEEPSSLTVGAGIVEPGIIVIKHGLCGYGVRGRARARV